MVHFELEQPCGDKFSIFDTCDTFMITDCYDNCMLTEKLGGLYMAHTCI